MTPIILRCLRRAHCRRSDRLRSTWRGRGSAVFPCRPRGKEPLTKHGFKDATRDEAQIRRWWAIWPNANIGLATGRENGIIVVDLDDEKGEKLLTLLEERFGKLLPTVESTTGGGRHLLFELPEGCGPVPSSAEDGLDIRADGGYVIVPPSIHPNGKCYEWDPESPEEFALAPEWLLDFARNRKAVLKVLDGPAEAKGASGGQRQGVSRRGRCATVQRFRASPRPRGLVRSRGGAASIGARQRSRPRIETFG